MIETLVLATLLSVSPATKLSSPVVGSEAAAAQTAPMVKNPRGVGFTCPDHALDNDHEIDIIRASDGSLVQTILGGDPPADATGEVVVMVNVQPIAFGQYRFVVRAVAGTLKSDNSAASPIWERAPGAPSNVVPK